MDELPVLSNIDAVEKRKKPDWLRVKLPIGEDYRRVRHLVDEYKLHTICQSGNCPNILFVRVLVVQIWANVGVKERLLL